MCRYAVHNYKQHWACFECRKTFKSLDAAYFPSHLKCPECGTPMANLGLDFKAPPRKNIKQWLKVKRLYENGVIFRSCGCNGPGPRPHQLREVEAFLINLPPRSEAERILKKFEQRISTIR